MDFAVIFSTVGLDWTTGQLHDRTCVERGEEVALPCESVADDEDKCDYIYWLFTVPGTKALLWLVKRGQVDKNVTAQSDRLSVTKNCSLVIENFSAEDAGQYVCMQP